MNFPVLRTALALLLISGLAACDGRPRKAKDDLVARVNGTEISAVGLLDQPDRPPELRDLLALEGIIDRELLVQQAQAKGIDRDPAVQQEVEEARHRIVSRVFVERSRADQRLSAEDITAFYRAHPGLFAQRQLFRLNEVIVVSDPALLAEVKALLASKPVPGRRAPELTSWLQARKIPYRSVALFKAAEQLPSGILRLVASLAPGDAALIDRGETTHIVQLVQTLDAPLSIEEAQPAIEDMIDEARRSAKARAVAQELRAKARIEYLGAFANARERLGRQEPSRLPVAAPPAKSAATAGPPPAAGSESSREAGGSASLASAISATEAASPRAF